MCAQAGSRWRLHERKVLRALAQLEIDSPELREVTTLAISDDQPALLTKLRAEAARLRRPDHSPPQRLHKLSVKQARARAQMLEIVNLKGLIFVISTASDLLCGCQSRETEIGTLEITRLSPSRSRD